jgi:hypothetical protein
LLLQRGLLPLHASAVELDGAAVAFCGPSGAGKSTLALHLVKRGHRLLCDDICAIDMASGEPRLWPGLINLKLWRESLEAVSEEHRALEEVLPDMGKYKLPIAEMAEHCSVPLRQIFLLGVGEQDGTTIMPLQGVNAAVTLVANTFRGQLVQPMGHSQHHFDQCIAISKTAKVNLLTRPWSLVSIQSSCAAIECPPKT